ncbi:hypothetical protein AXF42_Ash006528 [Apostasia shenzhenica]|uniref:Uncharacterized protein n=1 Tax=Apostasia shenzhenica TaxID=1088818 RepID=A0A2I0AZB2_9ASPA|nr:hypothetical protein AXF42_Ash006528 [Apostasia shenzhenica]
MALSRLQGVRRFHQALRPLPLSSNFRSYLNATSYGITGECITSCSYTISSIISQNVSQLTFGGTRWMSMVTSKGVRQTALKVTMLSPGIVYEPYEPREPIPFWKRWFTPKGWRRTKEDIILEMKNAYAIATLRKKTGFSKKCFYENAIKLYKEINTLMAHGDAAHLRKIVTEKMYSVRSGLLALSALNYTYFLPSAMVYRYIVFLYLTCY